MNTLDGKYQELLQDIIDNGVVKTDRTGTGTISVFGRQIRHKMSQGFPLLTTKKVAWKTMVTELLWFLRGDTNIKYLVNNGCHIWDGDAYKNYQKNMTEWFGNESQLTKELFIEKIKTDDEFSNKWGDLGPIYGRMWRFFDEDSYGGIDQIQTLIEELKTNPDSRRLMVTAWHPGYNQHSVLPPCHYGFQVYTRELSHKERFTIHSNNPIAIEAALDNNPLTMEETNTPTRAISLMWNQRSCDFPLGIPFNLASYGLLLEILAKEVNMISEDLIGNLGDCHIYLNQIDGVKEQLKRDPFNLPTVKILNVDNDDVAHYEIDDFVLENYQCHPSIKMPLSN